MKKAVVLEALDSLEEEFDPETLIERILFIEKINVGLKDEQEGRLIPLETIKQQFYKKWEK